MRIGHTTSTRLLLLGALYFAQGVPWGFITVTMVLQLTNLGFDAARIGTLLSIAYLPWVGKPLLGPFVDAADFGRWGRRRPIIGAAELGMAGSVLVLAVIDPRASWSLFLGLIFLHNAFGAFQDVATDGLAITLLPPRERGTANGVMSAAKYLGLWAGGPGLSLLASGAGGWNRLAPLVAILLLAPGMLLLFLDEPPRVPGGPLPAAAIPIGERLLTIGRALKLGFAIRTTWIAAALALTITASEGLIQPMFIPLLRRDLGFSESDVSLLVSLSAGVSAVFALAGGFLSDRLGRVRALVIGILGLAAANLAFALARPLWPGFSFVAAYSVVSAIFTGVVYSSTLALFMDMTRPEANATQFQIYMSLINLRSTWSTWAGGRLTRFLSPPQMFFLSVAADLIPLGLMVGLAKASSGPPIDNTRSAVTSRTPGTQVGPPLPAP